MTNPSLFCPDLANRVPGDVVSVERDEAAHLRALRARAGDEVRLTDGAGSRYLGQLSGSGRSWRVSLQRALSVPPRPRLDLWMPVGARDRMLWLAEKATELGTGWIRLVECDRSSSVANAGRSAGFVERLHRRCRAALTQSGGGWMPRIDAPLDLGRALEDIDPDTAAWVGDADGDPPTVLCAGVERPVAWLVGPEGGFTDEERRAVSRAGFRPLKLSATTLRFETAGLAGLVWLAGHVAGESEGHTGKDAG